MTDNPDQMPDLPARDEPDGDFSPDELAGEPVAPDHGLDIAAFADDDEEGEL